MRYKMSSRTYFFSIRKVLNATPPVLVSPPCRGGVVVVVVVVVCVGVGVRACGWWFSLGECSIQNMCKCEEINVRELEKQASRVWELEKQFDFDATQSHYVFTLIQNIQTEGLLIPASPNLKSDGIDH